MPSRGGSYTTPTRIQRNRISLGMGPKQGETFKRTDGPTKTLIQLSWGAEMLENQIRQVWKSYHVQLTSVLVTQSCPTLCNPWTIACQAPQSMEFSRQEYWIGLPFPHPGDLCYSRIEPRSPALKADSLLSEPLGKPKPSTKTRLECKMQAIRRPWKLIKSTSTCLLPKFNSNN